MGDRSSDRESGRRPSSQLRRAWSVLLYIRPTKWPFFACLSGLLPTLAATPNSVYGAISARKIRSRKRHAKIPIGSEIMTVQKMPFWDLEHTSSSSSPPSSSPDSFFPRFLTYFHCSDLDQTWYTYSLQHSSGGYFAVFRNSPPPSPKHLYFFYIQISPFLTHFQCSDLPEIWYAYCLQHSLRGYFAVLLNSQYITIHCQYNNNPPPSNLKVQKMLQFSVNLVVLCSILKMNSLLSLPLSGPYLPPTKINCLTIFAALPR